ncbi:hypothetical protein [Methylotuvimicrobium sp. KM2]|uniref:hypothetical protein n=1 Tax=Methylotuvimicrobium sp. KM2 TaxID=3133976 RepID=UPI0031014705
MINELTFIRGAAIRSDLLYVLTKGKALLEKDIAHTATLSLYQGQWAYAETTDWDSSAIAIANLPTECLVFIGEDGDVCTYTEGQITREKLFPIPKMIRNAKTISGYVFACGMLRQVYHRTNEGIWKNISATSPKAEEKVGFEAIDGFSLNEIYAVGWSGEIWEYFDSKWIARSSPTNLILTSVCCAPDNSVYIGGQNGTLIKGRNDSWEIIQWEDDIDIDIWDLHWFQNKLYVATIRNLYTLEGNTLVDVNFGETDITSCFNLTEAEGVMWSIGHEDVLSFDGNKWQKYN